MLPKKYRLPSPFISRVAKSGRRIKKESLSISYVKNFLNLSRFAFVVPKSVDKRATARNAVKRRLREAVRVQLPQLAPGWDVVISVDSSIARKRSESIADLIRSVFVEGGIKKVQ